MTLTTSTDYTVRSTRRMASGWVVFTVVDMGGLVVNVCVSYPDSALDVADEIIRNALAFRHARHKVHS